MPATSHMLARRVQSSEQLLLRHFEDSWAVFSGLGNVQHVLQQQVQQRLACWAAGLACFAVCQVDWILAVGSLAAEVVVHRLWKPECVLYRRKLLILQL